MRSMAAPVAFAQLSRAGVLDGLTGPLALMTRPGFGAAANMLATAELVADKLPVTPNRTAVGPLLGRAVAGGLAGAGLCSAQKKPVWTGALLGAAAAVGAAYGAYALRKRVVRKFDVSDRVVALAEDAIVGAIGLALVSGLKERAGTSPGLK